jgi:beta-lactam-binding protein with PASTA domain
MRGKGIAAIAAAGIVIGFSGCSELPLLSSTVPDLNGYPEQDAKTLLAEDDLEVVVSRDSSVTTDTGVLLFNDEACSPDQALVSNQNPEPGEKVGRGTEVSILMSCP